MHTNKLTDLPGKFQSFQFLRTLNLSKNSLSASVLDTVTHLTTLIELYLAHNQIEGPLPSDIASLAHLQVLDLEGNKLTSIPEEIGTIERMRILLLGDNALESVPWSSLQDLGDLHDLDLHSNNLCGDLIENTTTQITLPSLSTLDLHANSLTSLSPNISLPSLTQFNATQNAVTATTEFFFCTPRLMHLSLSQNQLSSLPDGIIALTHLRTLDISNNMIETIDPRLGLLEELSSFMWMGNLIRIRAWGGMDTEGIKAYLRAKADEAVLEALAEEVAGMKVSCRGECGGTLDLTKQLQGVEITAEMFLEHSHAAHFPVLTKVVLQQNHLAHVPLEISVIATLTTLDISKNHLSNEIFPEKITLASLLHLDLSINNIASLDNLPHLLVAPSLKSLDLSFNSLVHLIPLHKSFPSLTTLHVNSNLLTSINPNDLVGLEIVQLNNNSIARLPPDVGLVRSLRVLGVDGNTFRVPGRRVVEQGSAALLEWLRGRCVSDEMID
jgi:Leucine-rich repeat (LRR) protein